MTLYDSECLCITLHNFSWLYITLNTFAWLWMTLYGFPWLCILSLHTPISIKTSKLTINIGFVKTLTDWLADWLTDWVSHPDLERLAPLKNVSPEPQLEPLRFLSLSVLEGGDRVKSLIHRLGSWNLICRYNFTTIKSESRTSVRNKKYRNSGYMQDPRGGKVASMHFKLLFFFWG